MPLASNMLPSPTPHGVRLDVIATRRTLNGKDYVLEDDMTG
jgi:hypothetical protein